MRSMMIAVTLLGLAVPARGEQPPPAVPQPADGQVPPPAGKKQPPADGEKAPAAAAAEQPPASDTKSPATIDEVLALARQRLAGIDSLALIKPEASGTDEDLEGLEQALAAGLAKIEKLQLLEPGKVLACAGPEFPVNPRGIAGVAKKCQTAAALFVRVFRTQKNYDVQLWLVAADGRELADDTVSLAGLPQPVKAPVAVVAPEQPAPPPPPPGEPPPSRSSRLESYRQRALSLVWRREPRAGVSVGFATGNVAVGVGGPVSGGSGWHILRGSNPISELQLVELAGRQDLARKIKQQASRYRLYRNIGIGLTLAGFVAAGIAAPYFKQGTDEGITGAGVAVGVGSAAGIAGLIMWLNYGARAASATSPYARHHFLTPRQTQELIESVNDRLRRELELEEPPPPAPKSGDVQFFLGPGRAGAAAALQVTF